LTHHKVLSTVRSVDYTQGSYARNGVGYSFGRGEAVGSWRYLGYHMKSGRPLQDLSFNAPLVSAVFHW